jgi:Tfp pilus assembly protein PilO
MNSGDLAPVIVSIAMFVAVAAVLVLRGPLGRALARRIEGTAGQPDRDVLPAVDQLQTRVAELEQQVDRLHELEERLDFTERLLAQQREQAQLPR